VPDLLRDQLQTMLGSGDTLAHELGGGVSHVFVAEDTSLGRCVEVLAPELGAPPSSGSRTSFRS
jgi:hypothetical protein